MVDRNTVLVAMDGSSFADYALDWYMNNVHKPEYNVILFNCFEHRVSLPMPAGVGSSDVLILMINDERKKNKKYVETLEETLQKLGVKGKVKHVEGDARHQIIHAAEEEKAKMIIMGTRGMGTVKRTFIGSVSDHVLHHSNVPVLICRHGDGHAHKH